MIRFMVERRFHKSWLLAVCAGLGAMLAASDARAQSLPLPAWSAAVSRTVVLDAGISAAGLPFFMDANSFMVLLLGPWKDYARRQLLPDWGAPLELPELRDETRRDRRDAFLPRFAWRLLYSEDSPHHINWQIMRQPVPRSPLLPDSLNRFRFDSTGAYLQQTVFTPTYAFELSPTSSIGVSAVLAYQDFTTYGFGKFEAQQVYTQSLYSESSFGTGIRLGLKSELVPGLAVGAAYQTRIEMDPFYRYRGVYSEPGDFDIPASTDVGLIMDATSNTTLTFDVRRIEYSDVEPFASALLPNRFLSLLGDGTSPEFAWQDLTVYRVGWRWENDASDLAWRVGWSSARQPKPTSQLLAQALAPRFADSYWTVGVSHDTGEFGRLSLSASYTPADYFLTLNGQSFEANGALDRMEVEARWIMDF